MEPFSYWVCVDRLHGDFSMMNSMWLEHPGYPGYRFSPEGNAIRLEPKFKAVQNRTGSGKRYTQWRLWKDGRWVYPNAHRIIASIYCPNPQSKPCVNHIDGDRQNNSAENLEWVTSSENTRHARNVLGKVTDIRGELNPMAQLSSDVVRDIRAAVAEDTKRGSQSRVARKFGVSASHVSKIINNKAWETISSEG